MKGFVRLSVHTAVRAAIRMTPRMAAYQLKRFARNKTASKAATYYDRGIRATASNIPSPAYCNRIPLDLANFIGAYYRHTDAELDEAARGRFTILGRTIDFGSIRGIDWRYTLSDEYDIHL